MTLTIAELLQKHTQQTPAVIDKFQIGLTWSYCQVDIAGQKSVGFGMTPYQQTRTLAWPGTIAGQKVIDIAPKLASWDAFDNVLAISAINAVINSHQNILLEKALKLPPCENENLSVFYYFRPYLERKKIIIIGRYPNIDSVMSGLDYQIIERMPQQNDLPDSAAEYLVPQADWVFITASSLINKTFTRLSQLAKNAVTVLMGPSTPWLEELSNFDIDYLAGTIVTHPEKAQQIAEEGGGTRLFGDGVQYAIANISHARLACLKNEIATTVAKREALKADMEAWYTTVKQGRFPRWNQLAETEKELSQLDLSYKRLWDANQ